MKASVLVDNIKNGDMKGEWGLSIYIEYNGRTILLDTGASDLFVTNAEKMGLPISDVDAAVLSHAHYDHADGMKYFFKNNAEAKFFLRNPEAECYAKKWIFRKYIGIPKDVRRDFSDRITAAEGDVQLYDGVWLIPHKTEGLDKIGKKENMYRKDFGRLQYDDFSHEQSLVFDTEKGLVIFNSCSHGGADNIINETAATFPDKKVHAIIGGFHLYNKTEAEVRELGRKIRDTGIEYVCTGHCTGEKSYDILKEELGDILHQLHVGMIMEFR